MLTSAVPSMKLSLCILPIGALLLCATSVSAGAFISAPDGWPPGAAREEIRPLFRHEPHGGPAGKGSLLIESDTREGWNGWTMVSDIYRAPSKAAQAIVELHFCWAAKATAEWAEVSLNAVPAPAPRPCRSRSAPSCLPTCQ